MKPIIYTLIILPFILVFSTQSFSQIFDDFNDGEFHTSPAWTGDTLQFAVLSETLQLYSSGSDSSFLITMFNPAFDTLEWDFRLRLTFSPSSQNYARYYLSSDQANLEGPLQGYFLQFGETGSADAIELKKQSGWTVTTLFRCSDSLLAGGFDVRVKVQRMPGGWWSVFTNYSAGMNTVLEGAVFDNTHPVLGYTGLKCVYTSSNAQRFYLDDVYAGPYIRDTVPPALISYGWVSDSVVRLVWSEETDQLTALDVQNYWVSGLGSPWQISTGMAVDTCYLSFHGSPADSAIYDLYICCIRDLHSNSLTDTFQLQLFKVYNAAPGDIVFSEIMADPSGAPNLPPFEFVEIYNRSQKVLDLAGLRFSDASSYCFISADTILPGQYRAYTEPGSGMYYLQSGYPDVIGISGFPALNNDGDELSIRDQSGNLIDAINYDKGMYLDPLRDDNGWSLERLDLLSPCSNRLNWKASISPNGGTPGTVNSRFELFEDTTSVFPVSVYPIDPYSVRLDFSECPDTVQLKSPQLYFIDHGIGNPATVNISASCAAVILQFQDSFQSGINYRLQLDNSISDCSGNRISRWKTMDFALPQKPLKGELLINEIMFNPKPGSEDFVEISNRSNHAIDLKEVRIAHADPVLGIPTDLVDFSNGPRLIMPGAYAVASIDPPGLMDKYLVSDLRTLIQTNLPSYNDDEGVVVLLDAELNELDRLHYFERYHFPLISDPEGISLERISFEKSTADSSNWHSASASVGYATPGNKNSQYIAANYQDEDCLTLPFTLFSPDNDGYHDVLEIKSNMKKPGYLASIRVVDESGIQVRELVRQDLMGTDSVWFWDGRSDDGNLLNPGLYILFAQFFHITGDVKKIRKACVLAYR